MRLSRRCTACAGLALAATLGSVGVAGAAPNPIPRIRPGAAWHLTLPSVNNACFQVQWGKRRTWTLGTPPEPKGVFNLALIDPCST
jgi:hypothetical protein